jgi:hypothetical protein
LQEKENCIQLTKDEIAKIIREDRPFPNPLEQVDALILLAGGNQRNVRLWISCDAQEISALIGAPIDGGTYNPITKAASFDTYGTLTWLLDQPTVKELIQKDKNEEAVIDSSLARKPGDFYLRLTMQGWSRYDELTRGIDSKKVLMAMKFGDVELDNVYDNCFVPAVERTGFHLRKSTDDQPAGRIDDQLRVDLRTSRFIIADLTHENNGAYWEAGFAEGLGRPVIYTCKKSVWENHPSHFDTNHLTTVLWASESKEELDKTAKTLVATIRATLPEEANLEDKST